MALLGKGVAAIWHDMAAQATPDYHHWHCHEHMPERVGIPGFLRGRRFVAVSGEPEFFHFYETESLATLTSSAYLARLNDPTPWTQRVLPHFRNNNRTLSEVVCSAGQGTGAAMLTLRFEMDEAGDGQRWLAGTLFPDLVARPGIVGAHLLRGDAAASQTQTQEKAMRERPDDVAAWVAFIEGLEPHYLESLRSDELSDGAFLAHRVSAPDAGLYRLHFVLTKADLA